MATDTQAQTLSTGLKKDGPNVEGAKVEGSGFEGTTQVDLLRHGECEGGAIFRGSTDVALSTLGIKQMLKKCDEQNADWDVVLTSPLKRCRDFTMQLNSALGFVLEEDVRLREMHFGRWEGQEIEAVWAQEPALLNAWRDNPAKETPPDGEPLTDVYARVESFYQDMLARFAGKKILVVTHGGVIRVMLSLVLELSMDKVNRIDVPYASLSRFSVFQHSDGNRIRLLAHNF